MSVDLAALFFLNLSAGQSPALDRVIVFFAQYFPYIVAVLFVAFVLRQAHSHKEKWVTLAEGFGAALIARFGFVELIRFFVERPRPFMEHAVTALLSETSFSFPSGHAAFFFALSTIVYLYSKRWGIWFYVASTLIGIARVMAGVHYPTDILGGALLGIAVGWPAHRCFRTLNYETRVPVIPLKRGIQENKKTSGFPPPHLR